MVLEVGYSSRIGCEIRGQLLRRWNVSVFEHAERVTALARLNLVEHQSEEWEFARVAANMAQDQVDKERRAFIDHDISHGCAL